VANRNNPDQMIAVSGLVSVARNPQMTMMAACTNLPPALQVLRTCAGVIRRGAVEAFGRVDRVEHAHARDESAGIR